MDIKEFGNVVISEVKDVLGSEMQVELKEIAKNNGVIYHALIIRRKGDTVAPTIYIDSWFEEFRNGRVLMSIVKQIIEIYKNNAPSKKVDMDFFTDFAKVNEKLFFKLVNYEKNIEYLKEIPYKKFEDLALVPLCSVYDEKLGSGVIVIKKEHVNTWEISENEFWENVFENAARVSPCIIETIWDCLGEKLGEDIPGDVECNMYVVSNRNKNYGAATFLYPGVMDKLAKKLNDNLIIIPSSIHEVIVIPASADLVEKDNILAMVHEVNSTVVSSEEILSDNIYYYDFALCKLSLLD